MFRKTPWFGEKEDKLYSTYRFLVKNVSEIEAIVKGGVIIPLKPLRELEGKTYQAPNNQS